MNTSVSRKYIRADVTEKIATQTQKKVFEYKDKPGLFVCLFVFVCFLFFVGAGYWFLWFCLYCCCFIQQENDMIQNRKVDTHLLQNEFVIP